jgi:hypothetical protein
MNRTIRGRATNTATKPSATGPRWLSPAPPRSGGRWSTSTMYRTRELRSSAGSTASSKMGMSPLKNPAPPIRTASAITVADRPRRLGATSPWVRAAPTPVLEWHAAQFSWYRMAPRSRSPSAGRTRGTGGPSPRVAA